MRTTNPTKRKMYDRLMDKRLIRSIQKNLTPDLLPNEFWKKRNETNPMAGHCYVASEAYYHLSGEKLTPQVVRLSSKETHWFLKDSTGAIIDITKDQFDDPPPYSRGRGSGFLTKMPSKRAQKLIERVTNHMAL